MPDDRPAPIFVVGCQRSGTTMLRLVLDSHPHISCGPETRFLSSLSRITGRDWHRLSRYGFTEQYWLHHIHDFFDGILTDYAHSRGKERWADKTPLYALSLGFLNDVFPNCQIIHVVRDGRDVVLSHRKRFGHKSAVKATIKWPRYIEAARAVGEKLPADRYLEVRYEDVVNDTEKTLRGLLDFLHEPWDPAVLDYDKEHHDVPEKYRELADQRRTSAKTDKAIYRNRVGAHRRELDPLLRLLTAAFSGSTLRKLGYR